MKYQRKLLVCTAALLLASVVVPGPWRSTPAVARAAAQPVRLAPPGQGLAAKPGERGATFWAFDAQIVRTTTTFPDAVAVAERTFDGDVHARLVDRGGVEAGRLNVDGIGVGTEAIQYYPPGGEAPLHAYNQAGAKSTLDWANRQVYSLWKDRVRGPSDALVWQDGLMRPAAAARQAFERDIIALETEWTGGIRTKATRKSVKGHRALANLSVDDDVIVSRVVRDGVEIGAGNWFENSRILMWEFPNLTKGYISPDHLKQFGGWPFVPDMAWLNLQMMAFHHYKTLIQEKGFVARAAAPSWPARLAALIEPTLHANEPGCDDLHWLDGTVLRYCCDVHDACYEKTGCYATSWWYWWRSWTCTFCNTWVIGCFATGGGVFFMAI